MDATKLIEEAGRLSERASPGPWFERRRKGGFWAGGTPDGAEVEYGAVRAGDAAEEIAVCAQGRDWGADTSNGYNDACFIARARTLVPELAAALKASEERAREAEDLAAANLAANKRIVELEHKRDAALAELAQPYICPNCTAKLRRLDRMDSAGHAAYELDKARKDAAGQNKRAQKAEQEAKAVRAELARLTTPRPIADAPTDKPVLGIWIDHRGNKCVEVLRWDGCWQGALGTPLYREAEYLPLPEVKP